MELRPGYKQTEVGVIPEDWEVLALGKRAAFRTGPFGSALHKSDYIKNGVPWINPIHIIDGRLVPDTNVTVTEKAAASLNDFRLRAKDIIIARRGDMGRCAVVPESQAGWLCGSGSMIIRCGLNLDPDFVQRVLASPRAIAEIENASVGSTMNNLNQGVLANLKLQCPPTLAEQRAIAAALGEVDALLASLDRQIAKRRDLKQAAMQQLLSGQTRLPGFHLPWEHMCLGDLFTFKNGLNKAKKFFGFGTPIVNFMDVLNNSGIFCSNLEGRVSLTNQEISNFSVMKGDVLFTRTSETPEEVGMAAVILDDPKQTVFSGFVLRGRPRNNILCDVFKAYCFRSEFVRKQIISKASYTTRALTNGRVLSAVVLPVPSRDEQTAIAAVLSDMDAAIAGLERRRAKTRDLKGAMMQQLLTGQTRLVPPGGPHA